MNLNLLIRYRLILSFLVTPIARCFIFPFIVLNYCIIKSTLFLISLPSLDIFKLNTISLHRIKKFFIFQEIFITGAVVVIGTVPSFIFLFWITSFINNDIYKMVIVAAAPEFIYAFLQALILQSEQLAEYGSNQIDNMIVNISKNIIKKMINAVENQESYGLLNDLDMISDVDNGYYFWNNVLSTKLNSMLGYSCGIWHDFNSITINFIESQFPNLVSPTSFALKYIPIKVVIRDIQKNSLRMSSSEYREDLLILLQRLHLNNGIVRERGNVPIKYSDIHLDHENINLIRAIKAKNNDMYSDEFNTIFQHSIDNNNFAAMLKFLQKIEIKHGSNLGALYWNDKLQQAVDNFKATALGNINKPREHLCNLTSKVMQNPCYVTKPDNPSQRTYYELLELLSWISKNNALPREQSEENGSEAISQKESNFLLSQIHYDSELKEVLDRTCYTPSPIPFIFRAHPTQTHNIAPATANSARSFGRLSPSIV